MLLIKPRNDQVVIEIDAPKTTTASGLHISHKKKGDFDNDSPLTGKVIAVGPGKLLDSGSRLELKILKGDRVVIAYPGTRLVDECKVYHIVHEGSVIAVLDKA